MKKLFLIVVCLGGSGFSQIYSYTPTQLLCDLVNSGAMVSNVTIKSA